MRTRIASFGPFRLHLTERVLEKNNQPIKIGSRAVDILITLIERAPEVVPRRDLVRRVWGELVVGEANLRVHVASLRKALVESDSSSRYVVNIPGRGYCFSSPVTWTASAATPRAPPSRAPPLPPAPLSMVGRESDVGELARRLTKKRFVSIVGAGGIGKTTVVLSLAHQMQSEFPGAVQFFDLTAVEEPGLVLNVLATQLALAASSVEPLPAILAFLREHRMLLVFDSCEHVVVSVAALTESIFREAPNVHILTTSREALRTEGEQVHHLSPRRAFDAADVDSLTAAEALGYPAVQLFVKEAATNSNAFELTDANAPFVAVICRRLDGIPLALELAASRVGVYGVQGTASLLDKQFSLVWRGRRTALPRHQTLSATLDWSYNLLPDTERVILRRLAIFVGSFSLEAALDVAAGCLDATELTASLGALIDKSLVTLDGASEMRYRLLGTTRSYAFKKLTESGEHPALAQRHCAHIVRALEVIGATVSLAPKPEGFFAANLGNIRAALEWCFSDQGDPALRARLVAGCACHFIQRNLMTECVTWTERAIESLDTLSTGTPRELELLACFASSLMITRGNIRTIHTALVRALDIAERIEAPPTQQLYVLQALYKWQIRCGDLRGFRELTSRIDAVTKRIEDPVADAIAQSSWAVTGYFTGNNLEVRRHARIAFAAPIHLSKLNHLSFGTLHGARSILARNLWVLGYPEQARAVGQEAVQKAENLNLPDVLCYVLMLCVMLPLEIGDWQRAEELVHRLTTIATKHHLFSYARASVGWKGALAIWQGDLSRGVELLQTALAALHEDGYELTDRRSARRWQRVLRRRDGANSRTARFARLSPGLKPVIAYST